MPIVPAKCTNCGADLQVDSSKDAAVCPYCNTAYIVEKAITNFAGGNSGPIRADVVNIYNNFAPSRPASKKSNTQDEVQPIIPNPEVIEKAKLARSFEGAAVEMLSYGTVDNPYHTNNWYIYLKSDGMLGLVGEGTNYPHPGFTKWTNIKDFVYTDSVYGIVGLTFSGKCLLSEKINRAVPDRPELEIITSWHDIDSFLHQRRDGYRLHQGEIAIKKNGDIVSAPEIPELALWHGIKSLKEYNTRLGNGLVGITADGHVIIYDKSKTIKDYQKKVIERWSEIMEVFVGEKEFWGLKCDGIVVSTSLEPINLDCLHQVITIQNGNAIFEDGSLVLDFEYALLDRNAKVHRFGSDYIQTKGLYDFWGKKRYHLLSTDGRVDTVVLGQNHLPKIEEFEYDSNVISMDPWVYSDGKTLLGAQLFIGSPQNYRVELSPMIPDDRTQKTYLKTYDTIIEKKQRDKYGYKGLKNSGKRREIQEEIDFYKKLRAIVAD